MTIKELTKEIIQKRPVICAECGGKLKYIGGGEYRCMDCHEQYFDDFGKVRKFLYENGPSPAPEIVAATGVANHIVVELLKEGRIELVENSKFFLHCEKCGCAIRFGRICPDCAKKFSETISESMKESVGEKPRKAVFRGSDLEDQKMHYFNKDK
ncbi:MAG: hypothetical protein IJ661_07105 [Lachnospiraceae bacterium]|nr:hypothetical protein [Lachnospiraceae bacterium]